MDTKEIKLAVTNIGYKKVQNNIWISRSSSKTFPGDSTDHPITPPPTKSPGFEAIGTIAALFVIVMAIVYRQRKGKLK